MPAIAQHRRWWAAAIAFAILVIGRAASAQTTTVEADGAVNVGYIETHQGAIPADPHAAVVDVPSTSIASFFTELRPGISLQRESRRLTWRAGYTFSGFLTLTPSATPEQATTYTNQAALSLAASLSKFTLMTVAGAFAQGGTSFILGNQPVDSSQVTVLGPNMNQITATVAESIAWEVGRQTLLQETLTGAFFAPQDLLSDSNTSLTASLFAERLYARDAIGLEVRSSVARLSPLDLELPKYTAQTEALLGRWNHDFNLKWNGLATAGVEEVFTDTGSRPLAILPIATAAVRYTEKRVSGSLEYGHDVITNIQIGTVSVVDRVLGHGVYTFDPERVRALRFSAGYLRTEAIGVASSVIGGGNGNVVQADAAFTTALNRSLLATARYSLAYQDGQLGQLGSSVISIFFVGVTGIWRNTPGQFRPVPSHGERVDRSDGEPVVPEAPAPSP